jgi:Zn finger protein HypA/HybF involved in hydrogenase expression
MLPPSSEPRGRRARAARWAATLLMLLPLVALGVATYAQAPKRWENPHGDFRDDCSLCHKADAWLPAKVSRRFDHGKYGFALEGAHAAAKCTACHATLEFKSARMQCASCHEDVHRGEMGADCQRCHSARSFLDQAQMRRLHQTTRFPLTGGHAGLDCESCHRPASAGQLQFVGTRAACAECHMDDFRAARDPDHVGGGFTTECAQCHSPTAWRGANFKHDATGFPLTGAHRAVACNTCHTGGTFTGLSAACVSCHQSDYDGTTDPQHAAAGFSTQCTQCHNTTSFSGASFDHAGTSFPLTGAHRTAACASCHGDAVYDGKSTACLACHQSDYDGTTDPNHAAAGFPTDCTQCHGTGTWAGSGFDHSATSFPLTGAHVAATCASCHGDGVYNGKSTACLACHQSDYDGTTDPNHAAAGFPTDCAACHGTNQWAGATFDHDRLYFRINSGTHRGKWDACSDCHTNPTSYAQFDCLACHPHDDRAETDGQHRGRSGYQYLSSACYSCHRDE